VQANATNIFPRVPEVEIARLASTRILDLMTSPVDPFSSPRESESPPAEPSDPLARDSDTVVAQEQHAWLAVDPRSVTLGRIIGWFWALVLLGVGLVAGVALLVANWPPGWIGWVALALGALLALLLIWMAQGLPALQYRYLRYRLGPLGFEIRRGVLWRKQTTVPLSRVQHTDVSQGPLERRLQLGKLIVYTAGTEFASVGLSGLAFERAQQLRDALVTPGEPGDGV
jgi:hypothetical protein